MPRLVIARRLPAASRPAVRSRAATPEVRIRHAPQTSSAQLLVIWSAPLSPSTRRPSPSSTVHGAPNCMPARAWRRRSRRAAELTSRPSSCSRRSRQATVGIVRPAAASGDDVSPSAAVAVVPTAPTRARAGRTQDPVTGELRTSALERRDRVDAEADEDDLVGTLAGRIDLGEQGSDHARAVLHLDVEPASGRHDVEHLAQRRQVDALPQLSLLDARVELLQVREGAPTHHQVAVAGAAGGLVVDDDDPAVAGEVDVELAGAAARPAPLERRQRVLRRRGGAMGCGGEAGDSPLPRPGEPRSRSNAREWWA